MKEISYVINDSMGLHARPAGLLAKRAKSYASRITICAGGKKALASQLLKVIALGVKKGTEVTIEIEGIDEEKAAKDVELFLKENL